MDKEVKNSIESHSSRLSASAKPFFVPDGLHILLFLMSGFLILIVFNIRQIWHYLNSQLGNAPHGQSVTAVNSSSFQGILNVWGSFTNSRLIQILLWLVVGIWIYLLIWFVKNIFINFYNDMAAAEFVHPTSYQKKNYWESVVGLKVLFLLSTVTFVAFIFAGFKLISSLSDQVYMAVTDFKALHSAEIWIIASIIAGFLLYVFTVLAHIVVNSGRAIYKGL